MSLRPRSRTEAFARPVRRLPGDVQLLFDLAWMLRLPIGLGEPREVGESALRQIYPAGDQ